MEKQKKQLIILCALIIFVLAAFFILRGGKEAEDEIVEENSSYTVLSLSEADLNSFTVNNAGNIYAFIKGENGWYTTDKTADMLNQDTLEAMLAQILSFKADDRIEGVRDLSQFGLSGAEVSVELVLTDGTQYQLAFGDYNEMMGIYYLALNGSDTVYTTPINIKGSFCITWDKVEAK